MVAYQLRSRYKILILGLFLMLFLICFKLFNLQILDNKFLKSKGDARFTRIIKEKGMRGIIYDRNGQPLAVSTPVESVWINPKQIDILNPNFATLAKKLNFSEQDLEEKIENSQNKTFMYLKRHISPSLGEEISELNIPGVNLVKEYRRYYPEGEVSSHVVGYNGIDDNGLAGVEQLYNDWLENEISSTRVLKDRLGRKVEGIIDNSKLVSNDLTLSLDQRLQYLAYRELQNAVEKNKAKSGSVVVLDVKTGEVLAMVNHPTFNPNSRDKNSLGLEYSNRAITHAIEPGSAIKPISMAAVLEQGEVSKTTLVNTYPGVLKLNGGVVRDLDNNGKIDLTTILAKSSNIGISKLVLDMPAESLYGFYHKIGFGYKSSSHFPGESSGKVTHPRPNQTFVLATMAFGYGVSVTPLQLASSYATIGNYGIKKPVTFLKVNEVPEGESVLSPRVARQVVEMMAEVVKRGSGYAAKVAGYHTAGKTGTARKLKDDGYSSTEHLAVFAGLAPALNPRFSIVVILDEPKGGSYYSGKVAAPVFSKIAKGALRLFNVQPDIFDTQGIHVAQSNQNHS